MSDNISSIICQLDNYNIFLLERAIPENFLQILQNLKKEKISSSPNERHVENTPDERPYVKEVQKNGRSYICSLFDSLIQ